MLLLPINKNFTFQDCITVTSTTNGSIRKHICGIFEDKTYPNTIINYLSEASGIALVLRDSDMRFDGGFYYYGNDANTSIYLVPAEQLIWQLPWYLRRENWFYLHILCHPLNSTFDNIEGYNFIPTPKYITIQ